MRASSVDRSAGATVCWGSVSDRIIADPTRAIMADETMPRRDFLKGAAAGTLAATAIATGTAAPTSAQVAHPPASASTRAADLVLANGKVITVDAAFTIAEAIAVAGERILAVGRDAAMAAHIADGTRV